MEPFRQKGSSMPSWSTFICKSVRSPSVWPPETAFTQYTWSSSGLLFMWSVCSGFLSDRLVWSPAFVLLRPVRSQLSFSVHVLVISGLSLWIPGCLHQQSSPSPLKCPRCHGLLIHLRPTILTILCIHSLPCTINSLLHLLLDLLSGSYSERHERINV